MNLKWGANLYRILCSAFVKYFLFTLNSLQFVKRHTAYKTLQKLLKTQYFFNEKLLRT
jgi:hypothetical protein